MQPTQPSSSMPLVPSWRRGLSAPSSANRPPAPVSTLPARRLAPDSALDVDVSQAFIDPDATR